MTNRTNFYQKLKIFNQQKFCKKVSLKRFKINHPYWVNSDTTHPLLKEVEEENYYLQEIPGVFENRVNLEVLIPLDFRTLPIGCGIPFPASLCEEYIFPEDRIVGAPLFMLEVINPNLLLHRRIMCLSSVDLNVHQINFEHILRLTN